VEGHTAAIQLAAPTERYLQPKVAQSEHFITAAVLAATTFIDQWERYETRAACNVAAGTRESKQTYLSPLGFQKLTGAGWGVQVRVDTKI